MIKSSTHGTTSSLNIYPYHSSADSFSLFMDILAFKLKKTFLLFNNPRVKSFSLTGKRYHQTKTQKKIHTFFLVFDSREFSSTKLTIWRATGHHYFLSFSLLCDSTLIVVKLGCGAKSSKSNFMLRRLIFFWTKKFNAFSIRAKNVTFLWYCFKGSL